MLTESDYAVLLYGRSQTGKSSTIRSLIEYSQTGMSDYLPTVGTGNGKSCTKTAKVYQTPLGLTLDLPGPDDTELQLDTANVAKLGACELITHEIKGIKLLVLESLSGSTIQLRRTVSRRDCFVWK